MIISNCVALGLILFRFILFYLFYFIFIPFYTFLTMCNSVIILLFLVIHEFGMKVMKCD